MLNRHLPPEPLRPPPDRQLPVRDLLAIAVIVFVLSGGITWLLPGAAYEPQPAPAATRHTPAAAGNTVRIDAYCVVDLPHAKRRCAAGTIRGSVVTMQGY